MLPSRERLTSSILFFFYSNSMEQIFKELIFSIICKIMSQNGPKNLPNSINYIKEILNRFSVKEAIPRKLRKIIVKFRKIHNLMIITLIIKVSIVKKKNKKSFKRK